MRMRRTIQTSDPQRMPRNGGAGAIDGNRTFSYLGPNTAPLNVRMG